MRGVREVFDRFRPAAVPGAAGPVGVPSDRRAAAFAELEPVFAALTDVQETVAAIRRAGRDRAARTRAEAAREAEAIVARARSMSGTERADAASQIHRTARAELAEVMTGAERVAVRARRVGRQQIPTLRQNVVDLVRAELGIRPVEATGGTSRPDRSRPGDRAVPR
jgi:hypothetical protein